MNNNAESKCSEYHLPSAALLDYHVDEVAKEDKKYISEASQNLKKTLESFGVDGHVSKITVGPRITQFVVELKPGIRVEKVTRIQDNISKALGAQSIRLHAPISGKDAVGIEVPNATASPISLRPLLESDAWNNSKAAIPVLLGRDIAGRVAMFDLAKAPHLLIAGTSDSEKADCLNTLIMSLIFKFSPDELKLLFHAQRGTMNRFGSLPHLLAPIEVEQEDSSSFLKWVVGEMERRYRVLKAVKSKTLAIFNARPAAPQPVFDDEGNEIPQKLPIIVVIVDELSDVMKGKSKEDAELAICRIAQKGRAVGIHLVIATNSPQRSIVTGLIKANLPTKIAFRVGDANESRVILDSKGAEILLGDGDMLFNPPGEVNLERIQGASVSEEEICRVVEAVSKNVDEQT